jgi:hypothetical protein
MDFTVTVSEDDWDAIKGGWRCPALQIPSTQVRNLYVEGTAVDPKLYDVNNELSLIRWSLNTHPKHAAVHIQAQKALSTEELTLKWKKIAIVLPVVGALATGLVTARFDGKSQGSAPSITKNTDGILKVYDQSNDFLTTGTDYQFTSVLTKTKREAWFTGTTFYISTDQFHNLILKKLAEGVDLNYLILDPYDGGSKAVADLLGVDQEELASQCLAGIRTLDRIASEAQKGNYPGTLRIKLAKQAFQSRIYFFDPKSDEGITYYVPQINGTNSQFLPGFLTNNATAKFPSIYFNGILKLWNGSNSQSLENWKITHPDFK